MRRIWGHPALRRIHWVAEQADLVIGWWQNLPGIVTFILRGAGWIVTLQILPRAAVWADWLKTNPLDSFVIFVVVVVVAWAITEGIRVKRIRHALNPHSQPAAIDIPHPREVEQPSQSGNLIGPAGDARRSIEQYLEKPLEIPLLGDMLRDTLQRDADQRWSGMGSVVHSGVKWDGQRRDSGAVGVLGPYCPGDGTPLGFKGAFGTIRRPAIDANALNPVLSQHLFCPACNATYYCDATPLGSRSVGAIRDEARARFEAQLRGDESVSPR